MSELFIGLMSGTSADGIDAALVDISGHSCSLVASHCQPFSRALQLKIHAVADSQQCELEQLAELDVELGESFADAAQSLMRAANLRAEDIAAIGSHGQTVRHRPQSRSQKGFSLQIGDPNIIAERTGITTVADFRRRDIAAGGQGAPLVPAFHAWAMGSAEQARAIVNIGGMSNITWLPTQGVPIGFDLGPGNTLMDSWINQHQGLQYDHKGQWSAGGQLHKELLATLLAHPFIAAPAPKSTGRETFNLRWLETLVDDIPPQDVQRTLCEFTAEIIRRACIERSGEALFVCGGGARNEFLMRRLTELLPCWRVADTRVLGIDPQWVEAMAFAWLAHRRLANQTGNLPSVTGAKQAVPLGSIHLGRI